MLLDDFRSFVTYLDGSSLYTKWANSNPNELARWTTVRDGILAGQRVVLPGMVTSFGRALVAVALLYLDATIPPALNVAINGKLIVGNQASVVIT